MFEPFITYSTKIKQNYKHFFKGDIEYSVIKKFVNLTYFKKDKTCLGWGYKKSTKRIESGCEKILRLEDGYIRSIGLGTKDEKSWSLIKNEVPYYDSRRANDLELLLMKTFLNDSQLKESREIIEKLKEYKITKYNISKESNKALKENAKKRILIIEQVPGDYSLIYGAKKIYKTEEIIKELKEKYPDYEIDIKEHPENKIKNKEVYDGINIIKEHTNIHDLIGNYEIIVTRTSQVGFEALLHDKKVICYGTPFYAGWGLTIDKDIENDALKRRTRELSIEELVYISMVKNTEYRHPGTKELVSLKETIEYLNDYRKIELENEGKIYCINFSKWKYEFIEDFLKSNFENTIEMIEKGREKDIFKKDIVNSKIYHWGYDVPKDIIDFVETKKIKLVIVEDGFLRSKDIGAKKTTPISMVFDDLGIYFVPQKESRLESYINTIELSEEQINKAKKIKAEIIDSGVSKYNNANHKDIVFNNNDKKIILIPGQVDDDASVRFGSNMSLDNEKLIKLVRKENPEAYIVYKPHPDVMAKKRIGEINNKLLEDSIIDEIIVSVSLSSCLKVIDEVHTITSLSGFEALIYNKKVVCYGAPFYAGWGLTIDKDIGNEAFKRRNKKISIDELFYFSYIKYPRYYNKEYSYWTTPEYAIKKLRRG